MAACRKCSLHRPGLNANGICPSCVRFHGADCLPPMRQPVRVLSVVSTPARQPTTEKPTFADLFDLHPPRQKAEPSLPRPVRARATAKLPSAVPQKAASGEPRPEAPVPPPQPPVIAPRPAVDRDHLLELARTGQLRIEQLERLLDNLSYYGFTPAEGRQLDECLSERMQWRANKESARRSALIIHSQSGWWSLER